MSTEENTVNTDVQSTDIVADTSPLDLTSEVSTHFLSALINNDYSGLNDMEEKQLNDWLQKHNY